MVGLNLNDTMLDNMTEAGSGDNDASSEFELWRFADISKWTSTDWVVLCSVTIIALALITWLSFGACCLRNSFALAELAATKPKSPKSPKSLETPKSETPRSPKSPGLPRLTRIPSTVPPPSEEEVPVIRAWSVWLRRLLFFGLTFATMAVATWLMYRAVLTEAGGLSISSVCLLLLFALLTYHNAQGFWGATLGFLLRVFCNTPAEVAAPILHKAAADHRDHPWTSLDHRVAVVMPIYEEDVRRVLAGIEATVASLVTSCAKAGEGVPIDRFELHVLSDTRSEVLAEEELAVFQEYSTYCKDARGLTVRYRRREEHTNKKVGNISEFLSRYADRFDFMVVLDADSVMSGDYVLQLAMMMQTNPRAGIIQTTPLPVRQHTLFGRMHQFSAVTFGEIFSHGFSFWAVDAGTYVGHNAILRIAAFKKSANLPVLPGSAPLGGHLLSHDHVEAAAMRRAGWQVWSLPSTVGSYEEMPTNLIDFAARDFRWLNGELQHIKLLCMQGLPGLARYQLLLGVLGYLSSLLWFGVILVAAQEFFHQSTSSLYYGELSPQRLQAGLSLIGLTATLLYAPRLYAFLLAVLRKTPAPGGLCVFGLSLLLELLFSAIITPLLTTVTIVAIFQLVVCGRDRGWAGGQDRGGRTLSWRETLCAFGPYAALMMLLPPAYVLAGTPWGAVWLAPLVASVVLAVPLAKISSSAALGRALRRAGLLLTPFEHDPPPETKLEEAEAALRRSLQEHHQLSRLVPGWSEQKPPPLRPGLSNNRYYRDTRSPRTPGRTPGRTPVRTPGGNVTAPAAALELASAVVNEVVVEIVEPPQPPTKVHTGKAADAATSSADPSDIKI